MAEVKIRLQSFASFRKKRIIDFNCPDELKRGIPRLARYQGIWEKRGRIAKRRRAHEQATVNSGKICLSGLIGEYMLHVAEANFIKEKHDHPFLDDE
ncbi:hypothetical protein KQH41_02600 [bacterium]|nr:hypothetical protein [bacterium]